MRSWRATSSTLPPTGRSKSPTYILVGAAYAGAGYAHQAGANIRVELLLAWLKPPLRRALEEISAWCGLAFVLIAAWQVALFTLSNYVNGTSSYILQLPQSIPNFPIFVGLVGLALALLGEIRKLRAPSAPCATGSRPQPSSPHSHSLRHRPALAPVGLDRARLGQCACWSPP